MIRTDIASLELPAASDWTGQLRRFNLVLFALLPALLLFWRGGADAAASIIGISYLAVLVGRRRWDIALHPLLAILLLVWLVLNLLVSPLAVSPAASFSRSVVWLRFALMFAAAVTWLFQSPKDLRLVAGLWAATIAFCILDGLVQLAHGTSLTGNPMYNDRLTGPLERPNIGMFVARIGLPLLPAAVLLLHASRSGWRVGVGILAIAALAFILLTGERAAAVLTLLALVAAILGSLLTFPRYRIYGIAVVAGLAAMLAAIMASSERMLARALQLLDTIRDFQHSHYAELFGVGLDMWRQHPLLGVGMKNFEIVCKATVGSQLSDGCPQHPHNVYIEWLAETGGLGLLGYLAFLLLLLFAAWPLLRGATSSTRIVGLLVAGCLILLLFPITASQSLFSNWPALLFWTGLSMTMAVTRLALKDAALTHRA